MLSPLTIKASPTVVEEVERLGVGSDGPTEAVNACLDVIARAFVSQPSTALYLEYPELHGLRFWRTMASEILLSHPPGEKSLYAVATAARSCAAAAVANHWRPGQPFNMPQTDAMIRPEVQSAWDECGTLWYDLQMKTYDEYGEFINIDFIGVDPEQAGFGLGRRLLAEVLEEADAAGAAAFLAACGPRNAAWYARHGFQVIHRYHCTVPGVPGHAELTFMVRPPGGSPGGGGDAAAGRAAYVRVVSSSKTETTAVVGSAP